MTKQIGETFTPQRFYPERGGKMFLHDDGHYVAYSDYAELARSNEVLSDMTQKLSAELERLRTPDEPAATRPCVEGRSWCDGPDVKPVEINQCSECEMLMHPERFQACSKCGGIFHTDAECKAERTNEQRK